MVYFLRDPSASLFKCGPGRGRARLRVSRRSMQWYNRCIYRRRVCRIVHRVTPRNRAEFSFALFFIIYLFMARCRTVETFFSRFSRKRLYVSREFQILGATVGTRIVFFFSIMCRFSIPVNTFSGSYFKNRAYQFLSSFFFFFFLIISLKTDVFRDIFAHY